MDNVRRFLKALQTDPRAQRIARGFTAPTNDDEAVKGYTRLSEALGFSIPEEEMRTGLQSLAAEMRDKTERNIKKTGRLAEEDLDGVAGGNPGAWYPSYCKDVFVEDQWCWYADSCAAVINHYDEVIQELGDSFSS